jgi:hypothetical protein
LGLWLEDGKTFSFEGWIHGRSEKSKARRFSDGKIPGHYMAQVKTGLDIVDMAEMAVYIDNVFLYVYQC